MPTLTTDYAALGRELALAPATVERLAALFDAGHTIPFLARYRKEATGGLDEVKLREAQDRLARHRKLEARRAEIQELLSAQSQLTPALAAAIASAGATALEDLYLPFRPKRRTRASVARERGLAPLAELFFAAPGEAPLAAARRFVDAAREVPTPEMALAGARDVLAERLAEDAVVRERARAIAWAEGTLVSQRKGDAPDDKYAAYHEYAEPVGRAAPHRVLAVDRGEAEGVLRVSVKLPEERLAAVMRSRLGPLAGAWRAEAELAIADGLKRLLAPAIEREARARLTEKAQTHAIGVFAANLKSLLLQPPLRGQVVLGIDPGFRTGCKVAVVDATGAVKVTSLVIYPHPPQKRWDEARAALSELIDRHGVTVVAVGNGTAGRETEALVAETVKGTPVRYVLVSEAGASVYSASDVARAEFPDLDATARGTLSIARRLQDPLAELVKIEPRAIGVGQYQHDLDERSLAHALDGVVEDAVNHVGVDLNTASAPLLARVAGLNRKVAEAIVARRAAGAFTRRAELLKVPGLGAARFEQCAGFLRVPGGAEPLDATGIHPESYAAARALLARLGFAPGAPGLAEAARALRHEGRLAELAGELGVGLPTLEDVLEQLERPGRDPREDLPAPHLRSDVLAIEDLAPGMRLTGTVRNVVDFGAFVDVGLKQAGLVHVSELAERFVKHPLEVVAVGDVIEVEVLEVDAKRGRVALSRKRALQPS